MHRISNTPRQGWQQTVRAQGLAYVDVGLPDGRARSRWDESACYVLSLSEVLRLEAVTEELHKMCLAAVRHTVSRGRYADLGVPEWAAAAIRRSLESGPPTLYGRLDLWYDGSSPPKLLEYDADTPSGLVEAAIVQWYWLDETRSDQDQWNRLHERLVDAWRGIGSQLTNPAVHFGWSDMDASGAELTTAGYLAEVAGEAGLAARLIPMRNIGWDGERFVDDELTPITTCFKTYPWDWMMREPYGRLALDPTTPTLWIEPAWKLLLSSKALLAVLWELYPDHPNLLPAYLDGPRDLREFVAKPLLGRNGAAIRLVTGSGELTGPGEYAGEGYCFQQFCPPPNFAGNYVVMSSWVVTNSQGRGQPAGVGFQESTGVITDGYARFVPHFVTR
jgi:glutathionylspermidine synthase